MNSKIALRLLDTENCYFSSSTNIDEKHVNQGIKKHEDVLIYKSKHYIVLWTVLIYISILKTIFSKANNHEIRHTNFAKDDEDMKIIERQYIA